VKLIVPVLNRFDLLVRMVESIDVEATVYVINNSGDKYIATDFYHANPLVEMRWVNMPSNLGCSTSWNLGIKMLPFESKWIITSADAYFLPGACQMFADAADDAITLCDIFPYWQTVAIGQKVVEQIGLFDEGIHPAYFDDTEYEWRARQSGVKITYLPIPIGHDNSSTISEPKYSARNRISFANNQIYFNNKTAQNKLDQGVWSLLTRRANSWD
jgi:GT2 family glycosyltransferase